MAHESSINLNGQTLVTRKGSNERFGGKAGNAGPLVRDLCIQHGLMVRAVRDTIVMSPKTSATPCWARSARTFSKATKRWTQRLLLRPPRTSISSSRTA